MHSESNFTHFNSQGNAHMVDVAHKPSTHRKAVAQGSIRMHTVTLQKIAEGGHKKGDVLGIARIAAIMAAKKTADLIPLCHPIALTHVDCTFHVDTEQSMVHCLVTAETVSQTGVEMEALTAVQVALLTIYDMCKAIDRGMTMENIRLLEKTGGASGTWVAHV